MKISILVLLCLVISSCKTNIVGHYECAGKEELLSSTFGKCLESTKETEQKDIQSIKRNPIFACEEATKMLLCTPVYKEFF